MATLWHPRAPPAARAAPGSARRRRRRRAKGAAAAGPGEGRSLGTLRNSRFFHGDSTRKPEENGDLSNINGDLMVISW